MKWRYSKWDEALAKALKDFANLMSLFNYLLLQANGDIEEVRKYIDEALLLNIKEIRILHGKGSGILRKIIREYLSTVKEISQFRDEVLEAGGHGITVIILK